MGNHKNNHHASSTGQDRASSQSPGAGDSINARKKYFTTAQLMARWGVSAPTVMRLIEEGQLKGLKIRGAYRVEKESVELYERKVAF